jgi:uncharacterized protein YeaO (DUF488 family)
MPIALKHATEKPSVRDGRRVLVERVWPRSLSREDGDVDAWLRALGPSTELRRWLEARPTQWLMFRKRYLEELTAPAANAALDELHGIARARKMVTLVFAARNREHNHAVVLKELLEGMRKPPSSSGPLKAPAVAGRARRPRR